MGIFFNRRPKNLVIKYRIVPDSNGYKWYLEVQRKNSKDRWDRVAESFYPSIWDNFEKKFFLTDDIWYDWEVNKTDQIIYALKKWMLDTDHFRVESIPDLRTGVPKDIEVCDSDHPEIKMLRQELLKYLEGDIFGNRVSRILELHECEFRFEISEKYGWIQATFHDTKPRRLYYRLYQDLQDKYND